MKNDLPVDDVKCEKLKSKYEYLYSSFHVSVQVNAEHLKRAIALYMSPNSWPSGVFVKRYFTPKNGQST